MPTHNRAALLVPCLESLVCQSLDRAAFEVVVVDDGSNDDTPDVCREMSRHLDLRYVFIQSSGIAAAKNIGIFVARTPLLFFFDDDDLASKDLLREHVRAHEVHSDENVAVLGYTEWAPHLCVSEVMRYVTGAGAFLFSYGRISDGQWLDYTGFWGGRSSCKRDLLVRHGIFNQSFRFGSEDIELAYRLTRFGFRVVFQRSAIQYMNRPITFGEFCRRCEKQGRSQWGFSQLHPAKEIQEYCQMLDAEDRWREIMPDLPEWVKRVEQLEALVCSQPVSTGQDESRQELWRLYRLVFNAFKVKGIVEAARGMAESKQDFRAVSVSV